MPIPNPEPYDGWDSFEGVGDLPALAHPNRAQVVFALAGDRLPGVCLAPLVVGAVGLAMIRLEAAL